jgi:cystathionine beta-lyase/cystathionine gamma-synthase
MLPDPYTRLLHAALPRGEGAPSSPPIDLSSVHVSSGAGDAAPYAYGRLANPGWEALERALGELEGARALSFASGQAASCALMLALCAERPLLVLPHDGYYGTRKLAAALAGFGVRSAVVDQADLAAVERALREGPAVLWAETPTNPFLRVLDLEALALAAREAGAPLVVDNTIATAALQRPLDWGAAATITSLTKAASGHSDVVLGAVATRDSSLHELLREWRTTAGAIPGPFEAWVAHRGLLTLPLRVERQSATAVELARFLGSHTRVRAVHYPGLDPATAELARSQMPRGGGPLLSFELDGDSAAAEGVVRSARRIRCATSFGGVESSWERRARWSSESAPESLIRLSVGLEPAADLLADLEQALRPPS